jgi:hypothetical protein
MPFSPTYLRPYAFIVIPYQVRHSLHKKFHTTYHLAVVVLEALCIPVIAEHASKRRFRPPIIHGSILIVTNHGKFSTNHSFSILETTTIISNVNGKIAIIMGSSSVKEYSCAISKHSMSPRVRLSALFVESFLVEGTT